jgi:zinc D-Ala-D-Ala carboxypeptidase
MHKTSDGYFIWDKGERANIGKYFNTREFDCHCTLAECKEQRISATLVAKLDAVRTEYGRPITVTSGFRCQAQQAALRAQGFETATGKSTHELGHAADIQAPLMTALAAILPQHFKAVGLARTWAHVDLRTDKERRWYYK